jgi:serine/threonine protein kinase
MPSPYTCPLQSNVSVFHFPIDHSQLSFVICPSKIIGRGAFGIVVQCVDLRTGKYVAIKKILNPFNDSCVEEQLAVLREFLVLKHFANCPHIVQLVDIIATPNINSFRDVYFVMEYFPSSLQGMCNSETLSQRDAVYYTYQLLKGLQAMHASNLIHRDLKPRNLLVDFSRRKLVICDFGMVCDATHTMEDLYVTTRSYRAPELCLCYKKSGKAVDIWAAGCILAEMLLPSEKGPLFHGNSNLYIVHEIFRLLGKRAEKDIKGNPEMVQQIMQEMDQFHEPSYALTQLRKTLFSNISDDRIFDLLFKMLEINPEKRITASEALSHELFQEYNQSESNGFDKAGNCSILSSSMNALEIEDIKSFMFKMMEYEKPERRRKIPGFSPREMS